MTTSTIIDNAKRALGKLDAPRIVAPNELEPLGPGYWKHKKLGELRERPGLLSDADLLPNRPIVQVTVDGERSYRVFDQVPAGTWQRVDPVAVPRALRPEVVDSFDGLGLLVRTDGGKVRGPESILARLESKGYAVRLATDGASLVVTSDKGRLGGFARETLAIVGPLLVAHLRGEPLTCVVSTHEPASPALTLALGGAPWCGTCKGVKS